MKKDVIYIDTDDDITSIIDKIKTSDEKIVALVPPKRAGVLESIVNLRLLARSARDNDKKIVIVTSNKSLKSMSALAKIPVAKNLQSKPETIEVDEEETEEDEVIDSADLPVGELDEVGRKDSKKAEDLADDIDNIDIENEVASESDDIDNSKETKTTKIPNFLKFRKRIFIGSLVGILLAGFIVWAAVFAPAARITIMAKTEIVPISLQLELGDGGQATKVDENIIQAINRDIEADLTVDFEATGSKDLGDKASGTMTLYNGYSGDSIQVLAGSKFTRSGYTFISLEDVTVPGAGVSGGGIVPGSATVEAQAQEPGEEYNISAGYYSSGVNGITAYGEAMTGGNSRMATVVTQDDIQKASQAIVDLATDSYKSQLESQFLNGEMVIKDSFEIDRQAGEPSVKVGEEATDKVTLTSKTTFKMSAVTKTDISAFLNDALSKHIADKDNQEVYDNGADDININGYVTNEDGRIINVSTTAHVGPVIDIAGIKEQVGGLRFGEVQSLVKSIKGVDEVEVKFSYFWVNTVPSNLDKVEVEFAVENE